MLDSSPFSEPLVRDPAIALPVLPEDMPLKAGPLHKVQFVVEFVGTRSALAESCSLLLSPEWFRALGQPLMFCMRPADLIWQPLSSDSHGSYDSISLAWDYIAPTGKLSSAAARHLLTIAQRFGPHIYRRALPLPPPDDVDDIVQNLLQVQDGLDIGFSVAALATDGWTEKSLWMVCSALGMELAPNGAFIWKKPDHPAPLLSVTPIGGTEKFTLRGVQEAEVYDGVTIGFSMPICPAPRQALDGCFRVADVICHRLKGSPTDDEGNPLTHELRRKFHGYMNAALRSFTNAGLVPGSADCLKLFSESL